MRAARRAALAVGSALAAGLLLEGGLRLAGACFLRWQERRSSVDYRDPRAYRVLCVGESMTGSGPNSYPYALERLLNASTGRRVSVVSAGVPGASTDKILRLLEPRLDRLRPDMVVAMMGVFTRADNDTAAADQPSRFLLARAIEGWLWRRRLAKHLAAAGEGEDVGVSRTLLGQAFDRVDAAGRGARGDADAYVELGLAYRKERMWRSAGNAARQAIAAATRDPRAFLLSAEALDEQGKGEEGLRLMQDAVSKVRTSAMSAAAADYCRFEFPAESERYARLAIRLDARNADGFRLLGLRYLLAGRPREAAPLLRRAVDLGSDEEAAVNLADCDQRLGRAADAAALLKRFSLPGRLQLLYAAIGDRRRAEKMAGRGLYWMDSSFARDYRRLYALLSRRGIRLVSVQYPMVSAAPLRQLFAGRPEVLVVDNESVFEEAVAKHGVRGVFMDTARGSFGHCTPLGYQILARSIAQVIEPVVRSGR